MWIQSLVAAVAIVAAGITIAATDLGGKPPAQPVTPAVEKPGAPRCQPPTVNECRVACDKKKPEAANTPPAELAKKTQECKQACIQGC